MVLTSIYSLASWVLVFVKYFIQAYQSAHVSIWSVDGSVSMSRYGILMINICVYRLHVFSQVYEGMLMIISRLVEMLQWTLSMVQLTVSRVYPSLSFSSSSTPSWLFSLLETITIKPILHLFYLPSDKNQIAGQTVNN